jgi:hypothetical protein
MRDNLMAVSMVEQLAAWMVVLLVDKREHYLAAKKVVSLVA